MAIQTWLEYWPMPPISDRVDSHTPAPVDSGCEVPAPLSRRSVESAPHALGRCRPESQGEISEE